MHFPAGLCAQTTAMNNPAAEGWARAKAWAGPGAGSGPGRASRSRAPRTALPQPGPPGGPAGQGPGLGLGRGGRAGAAPGHGGRAGAAAGGAAVPGPRRLRGPPAPRAQRIEEKRRAALLGGGQARIDAQHKRVSPAQVAGGDKAPSRCRRAHARWGGQAVHGGAPLGSGDSQLRVALADAPLREAFLKQR